jgi:hypothetical protein
MFQIVLLLVAVGVSFAAGYAVRDQKSRRRRAIARAQYLRKQEQELYDEGFVGSPPLQERQLH